MQCIIVWEVEIFWDLFQCLELGAPRGPAVS